MVMVKAQLRSVAIMFSSESDQIDFHAFFFSRLNYNNHRKLCKIFIKKKIVCQYNA